MNYYCFWLRNDANSNGVSLLQKSYELTPAEMATAKTVGQINETYLEIASIVKGVHNGNAYDYEDRAGPVTNNSSGITYTLTGDEVTAFTFSLSWSVPSQQQDFVDNGAPAATIYEWSKLFKSGESRDLRGAATERTIKFDKPTTAGSGGSGGAGNSNSA